MLPNQTYSLTELARLESTIAGLLAGFSLIAAVLLLGHQASIPNSVRYNDHLGKTAVSLFVATFLTSTFASFLFAVLSAEVTNSARASLLVLPPSFVFGLSLMLLMLGIANIVASYELTGIGGISWITIFIVIGITLIYYTHVTGLVTSVVYNIPRDNLYSQWQVVIPLWGIPIVTLVVSGAYRLYLDQKNDLNERSLRRYIASCIISSACMNIPVIIISNGPINLFVPFWLILLFLVIMSLFAGWSILYLPKTS